MKEKGTSEIIISIIFPLIISSWMGGYYVLKKNNCQGFTHGNNSGYNSICDCQQKLYTFIIIEASISITYGILFLIIKYKSNYEHKNLINHLYRKLNLFDETLNQNQELINTKINMNIINDYNYDIIRNKIIEEIILSIFNDNEFKLLETEEKNKIKWLIIKFFPYKKIIKIIITFLIVISLVIQLVIIFYITCAYNENFIPIFFISFDTISTIHSLRHMT
jgi:hypothetical protein